MERVTRNVSDILQFTMTSVEAYVSSNLIIGQKSSLNPNLSMIVRTKSHSTALKWSIVRITIGCAESSAHRCSSLSRAALWTMNRPCENVFCSGAMMRESTRATQNASSLAKTLYEVFIIVMPRLFASPE